MRLALSSPEVLAALRKDPEFAEFFDADGKLTVDTSGFYDDGNTRAHRI